MTGEIVLGFRANNLLVIMLAQSSGIVMVHSVVKSH
jgi:hypothetical protein